MMMTKTMTMVVVVCALVAGCWGGELPSVSGDYEASRNFPSQITPFNVGGVGLAWSTNLTSGQSWAVQPPAVDRQLDAIYTCDVTGNLYAFKKSNGDLIWQVSVPTLLGMPGVFSRTSPVIIGEHLWYGANSNLLNPFTLPTPLAAAIPFVLHRRTGALVWAGASLDDFFGAIITGSPTYVKERDLLIWGVSSNEETFAFQVNAATNTPYTCCVFSGSVVGLRVSTRTVAWKVYTSTFASQAVGSRPSGYPNALLPFPGAAVWANGPSVDIDAGPNGLAFIGTGNNYRVPVLLQACVNDTALRCGTNGTCVAEGNLACFAAYQIPQNLAESLVVIDLVTGAIVKALRLTNELGFTIGCYRPAPFANCPQIPGKDQDFGQANLLMLGGKPLRPVIVMNQKGGMTYTIDRATYEILYANQTVQGGVTGGHQWGSAFHGHIVYTTGSNSGDAPLGAPKPDLLMDGTTTLFGTLMAYNVKKDRWVWKIPDPAGVPKFSRPMGAVAFTNGLMVATTNYGNLYVLDADDGTILLNIPVHGNAIVAGVAIFGRCIYVNTGYNHLTLPNNDVANISAFCLP